MIATNNQQVINNDLSLDLAPETHARPQKEKSFNPRSQLLRPNRIAAHTPKAGLNPVVDAASYLLSIIGKLKHIKSYRQPSKLQKELIQEIKAFQDSIKNHGYNAEYMVICRYILCAAFDDIISNTTWGSQGQWNTDGLLAAFNQDSQHQDKFFTIMERAIKEPALYIDLMELMYICLSMGYKGQYRSTEYSQYQLEQIINNLYKHIRAYRGNFSKTLSPAPLRTPKSATPSSNQRKPSILFIFFVTACIIMTIFASLGYLMDVISNEAYKNISPIEQSVSNETSK